MKQRQRHGFLGRVPHGRYLLFLVVLIIAAGSLTFWLPPDYAIAAGFDLAALTFIVAAVPLWREGDARRLRQQAARDGGGRVILLLVTLLIATVTLIAIGSLAGGRGTSLVAVDLTLAAMTLILVWTFANLVYAFHYARLYYDAHPDRGDHGGLGFPGGEPPGFAEFVNFSFVLGMTCQTADIAITSARMRRASTLHGMAAFFFNLGILALTVNVVASALRG